MDKSGLVAQKIRDSRGYTRTYWVKGTGALLRLAKAKAANPKQVLPRTTLTPSPLPHNQTTTSEVSRALFKHKTVGPHVVPTKVDFPQNQKLRPSGDPSKTVVENEAALRAHSEALRQAYGGTGGGVEKILVVRHGEDDDLHEDSAAFYRKAERLVAIEASFAKDIGEAALRGNLNSLQDVEAFALNTYLHESLHASTGRGQLALYEPASAEKRPYAAAEEATTEILTMYHSPGFQQALLAGQAKAPTQRPKAEVPDGVSEMSHRMSQGVTEDLAFAYTSKKSASSDERDIFVTPEATYRDECTQFARVACMLEKLDVSTPTRPEEVVKAAAYHAGEIKKQPMRHGGAYKYLSSKALEVFDIPSTPPAHLSGPARSAWEADYKATLIKTRGALQSFMIADRTKKGSADLQDEMVGIAREFLLKNPPEKEAK